MGTYDRMNAGDGMTIALSVRCVSLDRAEKECLLSWLPKPLKGLRSKIQAASHDEPLRLSFSEKRLLALYVSWGLGEGTSTFPEGGGLWALHLELVRDTARTCPPLAMDAAGLDAVAGRVVP